MHSQLLSTMEMRRSIECFLLHIQLSVDRSGLGKLCVGMRSDVGGGGAGDYGESVECGPHLAPLISRGNYVLSPSPSPVNTRTTGHLHYLHLPSI